MATRPDTIRRAAGPLQGAALTVYFALLPYVVVTRWDLVAGRGDAALVRSLLVVLAAFWAMFLSQLALNIRRLLRGRPGSGGSAWLAGLVVALVPILNHPFTLAPPTAPPTHLVIGPSPLTQVSVLPAGARHVDPSRGRTGGPAGTLGVVPLALMAKRRSDLLRQQQFADLEGDVDETVALLRSLDPRVIDHLRQLIGDRREGIINVTGDGATVGGAVSAEPVVACSLDDTEAGTLVAFAREGGQLSIAPEWGDDEVRRRVVALHDGRLVFVDTEAELLRALATRSVRRTLVLYLGHANDLDDELRSCAITLVPFVAGRGPRSSEPGPTAPGRSGPPALHEVRIDLLRADPHVLGLVEPMTSTLRRRCVEMLAYLALHRHEPVTGDRLRTRVLTHADVDASLRTLANTASALRRSLGVDSEGPRLHPVSSSGLYVTHGVTSDVEIFTTLVSRARQLSVERAAPLAHQALAMVKGEPLSSALRGFEWFLAEGYGARLSRDGEWAALVLHHDALARDEFELAFWALRQGLLIDPYSDVLLEASARVPRLREFGSDRTGLSQHETVGARGAEAMSWSLHGFSNQVSK